MIVQFLLLWPILSQHRSVGSTRPYVQGGRQGLRWSCKCNSKIYSVITVCSGPCRIIVVIKCRSESQTEVCLFFNCMFYWITDKIAYQPIRSAYSKIFVWFSDNFYAMGPGLSSILHHAFPVHFSHFLFFKMHGGIPTKLLKTEISFFKGKGIKSY